MQPLAITEKRRQAVLAYLGRRVRKFAADREMSLAALARDSGITEAYLHRVVSGQQVPSLVVVVSIADALEVPTADLLLG